MPKKKIDFDYCQFCETKTGYWEDDKTYIEIPHKCKPKQKNIEVSKPDKVVGKCKGCGANMYIKNDCCCGYYEKPKQKKIEKSCEGNNKYAIMFRETK